MAARDRRNLFLLTANLSRACFHHPAKLCDRIHVTLHRRDLGLGIHGERRDGNFKQLHFL